MSGSPHILAIDQGTTSTRAIIYDIAGNAICSAQRELPQIFPKPGWVEHDPEEIWAATWSVCKETLGHCTDNGLTVATIGISNQRETTILWDRNSGQPIHNAIVWQDRRTADACRRIVEDGLDTMITAQTGLVVDPYFSASKIAWLLDNVPGARARAEAGELAFGTVDSFLLWRMTGGAAHLTDATNAARTMLFNIHSQDWSDELLRMWQIPRALLPDVRDCATAFGQTTSENFGTVLPVHGMAGDQHAATIGQACFQPGSVKSTFGTGCFVLMNTGKQPATSANRLLTTVAYRLAGETTYALEGSVFVAGAAVQWLRDGLGIITSATDTETLAQTLETNRGVYMVPAFAGLGAPYWDADARGALLGLSRDTGIPEIARATLESVAYQSRDLLDAMAADRGAVPETVRVDGGMAANDWLMQFLADILDTPVERPDTTETTALGAARLAGLGAGLYGGLDEISRLWRAEQRFTPDMDNSRRDDLLAGWRDAVQRTLSTR